MNVKMIVGYANLDNIKIIFLWMK